MDHKKLHCSLCKSKVFHQKKIQCGLCKTQFKYMNGLARHLHRIHGNKSHKCKICNKSFNRKNSLVSHSKTHNKHLMSVYDTNTVNLVNTSESNIWSSSTPT